MQFGPFYEKFLKVFKAKPFVGGLEISDTAIRFTHFDGKHWQLLSERLLPGVVDAGQIKKYDDFLLGLKKLHAGITGGTNGGRRISVVTLLSSIPIYSQIFMLPVISGENLEKAIELNLQVLSPADESQNYAGWQIVGKDATTVNLEILTSFINRSIVDEVNKALKDAGFLAVAFEFRALALARLMREFGSGFDREKSYLMLSLDASGLDALVVRRGELYFEYFNFWRDLLQSDEREVPISIFESAVVRNINQVLNFYNQHWPGDRIAEVFVSAGDLNKESERIIGENFPLATREFTLKISESISYEWFISLGAGLRALVARSKDKDINFLGHEAQEEFRKDHLMNFLDFWRLLIPASFIIFLGVFFAADLFLGKTLGVLKMDPIYQSPDAKIQELELLQAKARQFNNSINIIRATRSQIGQRNPLLEKLNALSGANNVKITRLNFDQTGSVRFTGEAPTVDAISNFRKAIEAASGDFKEVNLPFSEIIKTGTPPQEAFSFSMSFLVISSKTN